MIDDPRKTARLVAALEASLPFETRLSASLAQMLSERSPELAVPARCKVVNVTYAGEEGGIVCGLDLGGTEGRAAHHISITLLHFDRKLPIYSQIEAYRRHRIKKLKREAHRDDQWR